MKPYGVWPHNMPNCCPGHDTYPRATYANNRSKKAQGRDTKIAHRAERHREKAAMKPSTVDSID